MTSPANKVLKNPRARHGFQGRTCSVTSVGSYVPEKILTNADLEKMVDTSDQWITSRTGIKQRRIAADDEYTSDMAAKAALRAMAKGGVSPEQIDLIIVATITPDMPFPATACLVQRQIGAYRAAAFDIEAACSGVIYRRGEAVIDCRLDRSQHLRPVRRRVGRGDFAKPPERPRVVDRVHGSRRQQGRPAVDARRRLPPTGHGRFRLRASAFFANGRQGDVQERGERHVHGRPGVAAPL